VSACTVKAIQNHKCSYQAADDFKPQPPICNSRNVFPREGRAVPAHLGRKGCRLGPLLRACQGKSCPLSTMCGLIAGAPNCADFTIVQIAAMATLARTRRRSPDARRELRCILVGGVQVGTVGIRAGSTMPVGEIVLTVGFQAQAHFTAVFKGLVGCAPLAVMTLSSRQRIRRSFISCGMCTVSALQPRHIGMASLTPKRLSNSATLTIPRRWIPSPIFRTSFQA
jgi:AraC-like DNA-binding protein